MESALSDRKRRLSHSANCRIFSGIADRLSARFILSCFYETQTNRDIRCFYFILICLSLPETFFICCKQSHFFLYFAGLIFEMLCNLKRKLYLLAVLPVSIRLASAEIERLFQLFNCVSTETRIIPCSDFCLGAFSMSLFQLLVSKQAVRCRTFPLLSVDSIL